MKAKQAHINARSFIEFYHKNENDCLGQEYV